MEGWMDGWILILRWMMGREGERRGHKAQCCVYLLEQVFALLSLDFSLTVMLSLGIIRVLPAADGRPLLPSIPSPAPFSKASELLFCKAF